MLRKLIARLSMAIIVAAITAKIAKDMTKEEKEEQIPEEWEDIDISGDITERPRADGRRSS